MRPSRTIWLRYGLAVLATAGVMIWQSGDAVRIGSVGFRDSALFWLASVSAGWVQMIVIARGVRASFGADQWPGWALLLVSALCGAVPLSFEVRWLVEALIAPPGGLPPLWVTYLNVSVINIVFSLIQYLLIERWPLVGPVAGSEGSTPPDPQTPPAPQAPDDTPHVALLRRRPEGISGVIRYLRMEDHYLHVQTDMGSGLALHRMSDAVSDLAATDGMQVHKSWWVARAAIHEARRDGRKRVLVLKDGTEVPVGRSFEPRLRAKGWI